MRTKISTPLIIVMAIFLGSCAAPEKKVVTAKPVAEPVTPREPARVSDLDANLTDLTNQITNSLTLTKRTRIAIVEFSDLEGNITEFGKFLSEELIKRLFMTRRFEVVERQMLNRIIKEHKLTYTHLFDEESIKEIGKLLGVDAIASGSVTDLGTSVKVNARLIATETGSIFAVASVEIPKDEKVAMLLARKAKSPYLEGKIAAKTPEIPSPAPEKAKPEEPLPEKPIPEKPKHIFFEDFSTYEEGDLTDWGMNVYVKTLHDGRKYLVASKLGHHPVGHNVDFPQNFYFQFDFLRSGKTTTPLSLVDEAGKKYSIKWGGSTWRGGYAKGDGSKNVFILPDGSRNSNPVPGEKTVRLKVKNNVIKVFVDGNFAISGRIQGYKKFVRFEVAVSKEGFTGWHICLTNFKVGIL